MTRTILQTFLVFGMAILATLSYGSSPHFGYDAIRRGEFTPKSVKGGRSTADGKHYTTLEENRIVRYDYQTGTDSTVLFDGGAVSPAIQVEDYAIGPNGKYLLLTTQITPIYRRSFTAEYWIYDIRQKELKPLSEAGAQQQATFSPDGTRIAFVRDNNLFVTRIESGEEQQLTFDGVRNRIINGVPDWVYEEEFALARAYEWSPDGRRIAWLRFDESRVKEYEMTRFDGALYPQTYTYKYPKAGEQNSIVELHCIDLHSGEQSKIETGTETDQYLPHLRWTPSGELGYYRLNRKQNRFEVILCRKDGSQKTIYEEQNDRYVELPDRSTVTFLPDGDRLVVRSERDGYMHLYLYSIRKGFLNRITEGEWEVTEMVGFGNDRIYYLSTETSPLRRNLYSIRSDGSQKKQLTEDNGTYRIVPSEEFRYYLSYFSNATTPERVTLHRSDGETVRTLEDNAALRDKLQQLQLPTKQFFTFRTKNGDELNGYLIRPIDFDSTQRYPVLMTQYSGPGSQRVADQWEMEWTEVLAQEGYIVACVDGRGTGFRGEAFKKCTYGQLGRYETEDQIEAARYLSELPYVDASRIGIYGWSYGGFMALNCILRGNDIFRVAIAVAPVTSWRYYDTIYTERYNGSPSENAAGYDDNSPIGMADRLKGKLLIAHGTADDNVHIQNTYEMVARLTAADRPFEMQIYPDQNHSMGSSRHHLIERCIEFIRTHL